VVLKEARAKLRELQPLAAKINEVSDTLRDEIKQIEEELSKLNLGLPGTIERPFGVEEVQEERSIEQARDVETGDDAGVAVVPVVRAYAHRLGYRRHFNAWRLVAIKVRRERTVWNEELQCYDWNEVEQSVTPLLESPRHIRIAATAQIPELLDLLKEKAKEGIALVGRVADVDSGSVAKVIDITKNVDTTK
jgi:hypothetical protein